MSDPVVHHVEICVSNIEDVIHTLELHGFKQYAKKIGRFCIQVAVKLGDIIFVVTQRNHDHIGTDMLYGPIHNIEKEPLELLCDKCEYNMSKIEKHVNTVFNIALNLKNLRTVNKIRAYDSSLIREDITTVRDAKDGELKYAVVKSKCRNVVHTLLCKTNYTGFFLPGFEPIIDSDIKGEKCVKKLVRDVKHIDHVTLAVEKNTTAGILQFYKTCFGMEKFVIKMDKHDEGIIMNEGIGIRLNAMEFFRCASEGLIAPTEPNQTRSPMSMMLVLVESLRSGSECNVHNFIVNHGPGVEHIALSTLDIVETVSTTARNGVRFRVPPRTYYEELGKMSSINAIKGLQLDKIAEHGILVDTEDIIDKKDDTIATSSEEETDKSQKYLLQIFTLNIFEPFTFFFEYIERKGSRGLGAKNIVTLVRSIREDQRRRAAAEAEKSLRTTSEATQRSIC